MNTKNLYVLSADMGDGSRAVYFTFNENDDADTADVFLQCCIVGDVIYG